MAFQAFMDYQNASYNECCKKLMEEWRAERLEFKKEEGKKVTAYPAREEVISQFMSLLQAHRMAQRVASTLQVEYPPDPYPPCVHSSDQLEPIFIYDLQLETHHRGRKILLRVCTEVSRMHGLTMVCEDECEAAIILHIEHQPEKDLVISQQVLQNGTILLLKEPFFLRSRYGGLCLRVDHVSDLICFQDQDERIPLSWRFSTLEMDSVKTRLCGNNYFKQNELGNALQLYTQAIKNSKTFADARLAHINRSLVYLRLGRHEEALDDAVAINSKLEPTEKGMLREATCLYKLQKFDQCLSKLQELHGSYPNNREVRPEIQKVTARLRECNDGIYDWRGMRKQARDSPPLVDCGTFSKNVEVRESPGKGRGLFTTKPVVAGELLVCEKAFAYSSYDAEESKERGRPVLLNVHAMSTMPVNLARNLTRVVHKLYYEPEAASSFLELDHGDYTAPQRGLLVDSKPVVDSFLAAQILTLNSFTAPTSTLESLHFDPIFENSGIWCTAAYINHSCVPNCHRAFIGDMIIIRAAGNLPAGTELELMYKPISLAESYEQTQKRFDNWKFSCTCCLCDMKKNTSSAGRQQLELLSRETSELLVDPRPADIRRARLKLIQMAKIYERLGQGRLRFTLQNGYFNLARALVEEDKLVDAAAAFIRILEFGDFILAPRSENGDQSPAVIEIRKWGPHTPISCSALVDLWSLCTLARVDTTAPGQFARMRAYAEIAHSLMFGEKETFDRTYNMTPSNQ